MKNHMTSLAISQHKYVSCALNITLDKDLLMFNNLQSVFDFMLILRHMIQVLKLVE